MKFMGMPKGHVVFDDEGEIFEDDPTVGRGVPKDPAGQLEWQPLTPIPLTAELKAVVTAVLDELPKTS
ncbi:hypothetical protein LSM04_002054 [Trypanosoma melophagium]|uniref:uncharacterized protein n=1 Tax=Trypanosoma melophagium TaxID=715481 RepID=UPI00351A1FE1|nr:hypothetical protein LSM04_002054 [Trypanosoma melophagium]